jgi:hypothetical protein
MQNIWYFEIENGSVLTAWFVLLTLHLYSCKQIFISVNHCCLLLVCKRIIVKTSVHFLRRFRYTSGNTVQPFHQLWTDIYIYKTCIIVLDELCFHNNSNYSVDIIRTELQSYLYFGTFLVVMRNEG